MDISSGSKLSAEVFQYLSRLLPNCGSVGAKRSREEDEPVSNDSLHAVQNTHSCHTVPVQNLKLCRLTVPLDAEVLAGCEHTTAVEPVSGKHVPPKIERMARTPPCLQSINLLFETESLVPGAVGSDHLLND